MGTIIPFVPLAKSWVKYLPKIADRPYTKIEAALCLMVDYDNQTEVTVRGYAKLWGWNKKTVAKFIKDHGAEIIYPKDTGSYKNQRGSIGILKRDQSVTNKGSIRFIDNRELDSNRDQKVTNKGPKSNQSVPPTIEPKPKPKPEKKNNTILKPENVSEQTWNDYLLHRKTKKANVTQTALNLVIKEADKAGWTLEEALKESVARGWTGFKADWVNKNGTNTNHMSV